MTALLALTLALQVSASVDPAAAAADRFVIAIGFNGHPGDARGQLEFADDDAAHFFEIEKQSAAKRWLLTRFDETSADRFAPLATVARAPTRGELARVLGEVQWEVNQAKAKGRTTELVLYFAGHGVVDERGSGRLILADGPLSRNDIYQQLVLGSPTDLNHIIIDACSAYAVLLPRGGPAPPQPVRLGPDQLGVLNDQNAGTKTSAEEAEAWARTGLFLATSDAQEAHESGRLRGGQFSFLLRSALVGGADSNADGLIEYAEAAAFLSAAASYGNTHHARRAWGRAPKAAPHAPLARIDHPRAAFLEVPPSSTPQHVRVLDSNGDPYAEFVRSGRDTQYILLHDTRYVIVQKGEQEAVLVPHAPGAYPIGQLRFYDARARGQQMITTQGRQAFSAAFVAGFVANADFRAPVKRGVLHVERAPGQQAPGAPPWGLLAGVSGGLSVTSGILTVGAVALNLVLFAAMSDQWSRTGAVDDGQALQLEAVRIAAGTLGALTLAFAGAATALGIIAVLPEEDS